ncbi:MAG: glutamate--tRNA ligase [bacterium]
MLKNIRVRFAPSPTGFLHIGSLSTVLFNYLIAKTLNGKLILRIEDTDKKREIEGAVENLINILDWVGIKFDEGPHVGGDYGPYTQSQRMEIYKKHSEILLEKGAAYRCFCSEERLKNMRESRIAGKLPPRYDRACRDLHEDEIKKKISDGRPFVIRQKIPLEGETAAHDELRGDIKFKNSDLEDQVLIKSDGMPTYQFANVVDDHLMEISHVLRGDEWIPSFPKNILLYKAFGWQAPEFIHLTLTLNKDGGKLSKRQGDVSVEDYKSKGYLPEALLNFCVLQGWHPKGEEDEILTLEQMINFFNYKDMGTSPAIFDIEKLDYLNGYYIRRIPLEKLTELCLPYLGEEKEKFSFDYIKKVIATEHERLKKLSEIGELTKFFFKDELDYDAKLLIWKKLDMKKIKENLLAVYEILEKISDEDWLKENIEKNIIDYLKEKELKTGDYLWPMRVALTGLQASPGPFETAEVLGKKESLKRISQAVKKIQS